MPTIFAVPTIGLMIMVVMPRAMVILWQVMVRAKAVTAPPARIGEFVKYFPAIVATEHYA
jgi:hypothetical protein